MIECQQREMQLIVHLMSLQFYRIGLIVCLVAYPGVKARIVSGPANTAGIVGSAVQLKCTVSQRTCEGIVWSTVDKTGQSDIISIATSMRQTFGGRYHVNVSSVGECSLSISGLQLSDAGIFTCDASTQDTGTDKKSAVLSVLDSIPQLSSNVTQKYLLEGDRVNISCSLTYVSKLDVTIELTQAGESILSEQIPQMPTSPSWIIKFVVLTARRKEQLGPFRCQVIFTQTQESAELARNRAEFQSNEISALVVHFPVGRSVSGSIIPCNLEPDETTFAPGKPVNCQCDGFPVPTYKWMRRPDNVTIVNGQVISINQSTPSTYQCIATNVVNRVTFWALSPEVNFNGTEPLVSASVVVPIVVSIVIGVLLVIAIVFIIWKKKQLKRSSKSSSAPESSKSSRQLMPKLSNPAYERPTPGIVRGSELPPTPPDPLPSPTQVTRPTTAARRQPPITPTRIKTPDHPDVVPYSMPARPVPSAESNSESDQIVYAEIAKPAPQKPPRATTPQSDTVYATVDIA